MDLVISALERQLRIEEANVRERKVMLADPGIHIGQEMPHVIPGYIESLKQALEVLVLYSQHRSKALVNAENKGFQAGYMKRIEEEKEIQEQP